MRAPQFTSGVSPGNEKSNRITILYHSMLLDTNYVDTLGAFERQSVAGTREKKCKNGYAFFKYLLVEGRFSKSDACDLGHSST